ncbi:MAG: V-type ATPase subunit [Nitrospirae bacterium]|nr:V-type ATPase subunit [Nitrospirota bacterium]
MSDFNYLAGRIGAMRSGLLTRRAYEDLIALPDIPALLAYLRNGPYGPMIERVGEAFADTTKIEEGLRRDFSATLAKLFRMSAGEPREAVEMLLGAWDVYDIKTILRGKQIRLSPEEIVRSLIPTGSFDEPALWELARQPSLPAVAELIQTWRNPHAAALMKALRDYHEPRDLYLLELALDRSYLLQPGRFPSDGPASEPLRFFLSFLADKTNLMTALKMAEERTHLIEREKHFLPGGVRLSYPTFVKIQEAGAAGGLAEALVSARATRFGPILAGLGEPPAGIALLSWAERRLEKAVLQTAHRIHRADPLGIGTVTAFLWDKIQEVMNLRMILRGRQVRLPEPALRALLSV